MKDKKSVVSKEPKKEKTLTKNSAMKKEHM
jgi:hypothetical protein